MHLKLLLGLDPYQDEVLPLHPSITLGFLSKVLIIVNMYVRSQSMYTWAASSLEPLLWVQLAVQVDIVIFSRLEDQQRQTKVIISTGNSNEMFKS